MTSDIAGRNEVLLIAYDAGMKEVQRLRIPENSYYESSHALIDSNEFRQVRGIRKVKGFVFEDDGSIYEEFENIYSGDGAYVSGYSKYSDGTVQNV